MEGGAALPITFDAYTVGAFHCGRYSRQHGRRDELCLVVLVPGHVEYNGLHGLRKDIQREACVTDMLRLHADHVERCLT